MWVIDFHIGQAATQFGPNPNGPCRVGIGVGVGVGIGAGGRQSFFGSSIDTDSDTDTDPEKDLGCSVVRGLVTLTGPWPRP